MGFGIWLCVGGGGGGCGKARACPSSLAGAVDSNGCLCLTPEPVRGCGPDSVLCLPQ